MQLGEQSGYLPEWRVGGAREEQETYTHRREHSTMNINNIILSFLYIVVFIGRNTPTHKLQTVPQEMFVKS